jgi:hypothetical protein
MEAFSVHDSGDIESALWLTLGTLGIMDEGRPGLGHSSSAFKMYLLSGKTRGVPSFEC